MVGELFDSYGRPVIVPVGFDEGSGLFDNYGRPIKVIDFSLGFFLNKLDRLLVKHASDHNTVVFQGSLGIPLKIGTQYFYTTADVNISTATNMDAGAVAAGTDYCVYACDNAGSLVFLISLNTTVPAGYDAAHSRKIGGFHTLCVNVGAIGGHTLTGYVANDILPASIWDLKHRPISNPAGMVYVEAIRKWVDIYLMSGTGAATASVYNAAITDTRNWMDFVDNAAAVKKRLLEDDEFQVAAAGSNEATNIAGSNDPVTTGGHSDTAGRRMISNYGLEDCAGAMYQWLKTQSYRFDGGVLSIITAAKTLTITHGVTAGANEVYLKYDDSGRPYLCCNMATTTVDKRLTFGAAYVQVIKHDAGAATGLQVYFDEDATQPSRLLAILTGLKDNYLDSSNPLYSLKVTYNVAPGTPGVALYFDDGAHQQLEFTSPTLANGTLDLALITFVDPSFAWYALPGGKGQFFKQGTYGDAKLLAGLSWADGADCGSRGRVASRSRWAADAVIGGRALSDPL